MLYIQKKTFSFWNWNKNCLIPILLATISKITKMALISCLVKSRNSIITTIRRHHRSSVGIWH
nr:MAG TPA: hypothetical protein [Bacteriophage sp.]